MIKLDKRVVPDFPEMQGEANEMVADAEIEKEIEEKAGPAILSEPKPIDDPPKLKDENYSVDQLRYMLEQALVAEADARAEKKIIAKPPTKAPRGMAWVFNRGPQKAEWQYDGIVYEIEGHSMELFQESVARHGRKRSLLSLDPIANKAVFRLALEGEEKFGVPLKVVNRTELLDRSHATSLLGDGSPVRTKPRLIQVDGVAEMMSRRPDQYAELE